MSDQGAHQPLLDVMTAAGLHDEHAALTHLDTATAALGPRPHRTHQSISLAREAAHQGAWGQVWQYAYDGIVNLATVFPPDPAAAPPRPAETPFAAATCPCGQDLTPGSRFCPRCGKAAGGPR